jgi:predicted RNA-binding protein with PUA domain
MDYETRATSRNELRLLAKLFRSICGFTNDEPIDPIALLDRLPELEGFEDVRYEIVYNDVLPAMFRLNVKEQKMVTSYRLKNLYIWAHMKKRPAVTVCI